jgi:hypothetical protein
MRRYRRRFKKKNVRRRLFGRRSSKTIWRYRRRTGVSRRRKRIMVYKKRVLRKARRRGAFINFTARRTNQISLEIDLNASTGPENLNETDFKQWCLYLSCLNFISLECPYHSLSALYRCALSGPVLAFRSISRDHCLKSVSFKFDNFKVRTCIRTETTEGATAVMPPTTTTREQFIEPALYRCALSGPVLAFRSISREIWLVLLAVKLMNAPRLRAFLSTLFLLLLCCWTLLDTVASICYTNWKKS